MNAIELILGHKPEGFNVIKNRFGARYHWKTFEEFSECMEEIDDDVTLFYGMTLDEVTHDDIRMAEIVVVHNNLVYLSRPKRKHELEE